MSRHDAISWSTILVSTVLGGLVAVAAGHGGATIGPASVFLLAAVVAYGINWLVFVPSFRQGTERYFDLTGSLTYVTVTVFAAVASTGVDLRGWLAVLMVTAWAGRLGSYLFSRVRRDGKDGRFDELKGDGGRFLMTWTLQGLWVVLTLAAALVIVTSDQRRALGVVGGIGVLVWGAGFAIEAAADRQKSVFRADPANQGQFISTGLWSWSRHPNYFGEIVLWTGMAILAIPVMSGWQWVALISPVFVFVLLTRISGVPLLEARADTRWGDDPAYEAYKLATPVLLLRPPRVDESSS